MRSGNPILRSPEGRSDYRPGNDNMHNGTNCFSRVSAISRPAPLFCILFSGKTEKSMPPEAQLRCYRNNGTSGEIEESLPHPPDAVPSAPLARHDTLRAQKCPPFGVTSLHPSGAASPRLRRAYFPTQKRSKMRFVMSSRMVRPVTSPRADMAASTSTRTASGVIPARRDESAASSDFPARRTASA